jgi:sugar phosphate isomerase/epimerase
MSWSLGIATGACIDRPICDVLDVLWQAGVPGVELGTPPRHFDLWNAADVAAVGQRLRDLPLRAVSIHAPFGDVLDLAHPDPRHRQAGVDATLTAARIVKRLGGAIVVAHPSDIVRHGADISARLDASAASLRAIAAACRQEGVQLAIESPLPHLIGGHPDEFGWLLSRVADPAAGVCLDTGHIALGHAWRRFVARCGSRVIHVHASDNHGQYDDHLVPGEGNIDWPDVAAALHELQFGGWVMLELRCPGGDAPAHFRWALEHAARRVGPAAGVGR